MARLIAATAAALALLPTAAEARILGKDAAACFAGDRPVIEVSMTGLKDRSGSLRFNLWADGAGWESDAQPGRAKPPLAQSVVNVLSGVRRIAIRAQYLRGIIPSLGSVGT